MDVPVFRQRAWILFFFLFPVLASEGGFFGIAEGYVPLFLICISGIALGVWSLSADWKKMPGQSSFPRAMTVYLFVSWAALSLLWTVSYDYSIHLLIPIVIGSLFYVSLVERMRDPSFCTKLFTALVFSSAILSIYAVYQVIDNRLEMASKIQEMGAGMSLDIYLEQARGFRPNSLFKDANTYGSFLSILFPLNLFLILRSDRRGERTVFLLVLLLNLAGLFYVASRGPAMLASFSFLAILLYEGKGKAGSRGGIRRFLPLVLSLAAGLVILQAVTMILGSQSLLARIVDVDDLFGYALTKRFLYWKAALGAFCDSPWLGGGLNTLQQTIFIHLEPGTYTRLPHNILFQFMAEMGLPGVLLFLAIIFSTLWVGLKNALTVPKNFYGCLAFLTLVIYAVFDITFQCATIVFLFFVLVAVIHGLGHGSEANEPPVTRKKHPGLIFKSITLLLIMGNLMIAGEAYKLYGSRHDLDVIKKAVPGSVPFEITRKFEAIMDRPHLVSLRAFSDWLLSFYRKTGNEVYLDRGILRRVQAYERGGRNPCDAFGIAMILLESKRDSDAEQWFKVAVEGFPSNLKIWRHYLELLIDTGREDEAINLIPGLIDGMIDIAGIARYYAIEYYFLERMLADLHERHNHLKASLRIYRRLHGQYVGKPYIEAYEPMSRKLLRMPMESIVNDLSQKIEELQKRLGEKKKRSP